MSNDITFNDNKYNARTAILADEAATLAIAAKFAGVIEVGIVVYLHGDLGAGKTTFVRGMLHALGHIGKVKSPTYTLIEPYAIKGYNVYHFDLYRFIDKEEWEEAGFREYFNAQSICMVEWPEKAENLLPQADIDVKLSPFELGRFELSRKVQFTANSVLGQSIIGKLCLEKR
jgi:tRNA threonylcarbamoyladenosine biosynthesis protein TsaE